MSDLTLDQLLASLEDDSGLDKEASDKATEAENKQPSVADELESILTKEAGEAKVAAADEQTKTSTEETSEMNKEAQDKGAQLADVIIASLMKQANEAKDQSEALAAEQDSETERNPEGTVNQVLKSIMDRAKASGGTETKDQEAGDEVKDEGKIDDTASEKPVNSDIEKAAAITHLVSKEGYDFEQAVSLVKEAEEAILAEELEHVKVAAVNELLGKGIGIEDAVALVSAELNASKA